MDPHDIAGIFVAEVQSWAGTSPTGTSLSRLEVISLLNAIAGFTEDSTPDGHDDPSTEYPRPRAPLTDTQLSCICTQIETLRPGLLSSEQTVSDCSLAIPTQLCEQCTAPSTTRHNGTWYCNRCYAPRWNDCYFCGAPGTNAHADVILCRSCYANVQAIEDS